MSTPLVSFVVPSYNVAPFVADCIHSILAQTAAADFEIILLNDASTDHTDAVARTFTDSRLRYICHPRNQGHIVTINEGFAAARGKYIARIDSDDRYRPTFLEQTLPVLEAHPDVGLAYGDIAIIGVKGELLAPRSDTRHGGRDFCGDEYIALLEDNFISAPTVIGRREAWANALPIPDGLGFTDWYLSLRVARSYPLYFVSDVLAEYRLHSSNLHRRMVRDYSEERTIFRLLDQSFTEPDHAAAKRANRGRIYAVHAARLGDKYFGQAMFTDARRMYIQAARTSPRAMARAGLLRRFAATYNPVLYHRFKALVQAAK